DTGQGGCGDARPPIDATASRGKMAAAPGSPQLEGGLGAGYGFESGSRSAPALDHLGIEIKGGSIDGPATGIEHAGQLDGFPTQGLGVTFFLKDSAAGLPRQQCCGLSGHGQESHLLQVGVDMKCARAVALLSQNA